MTDKEMKTKKKTFSFKTLFLLFIICVATTLLWARYVSTRGLVVKEYAIKETTLNEDWDGLKIVHFTDLHYGSTIFLEELKNIVKEINKQNPDLIVFTGDLIEQGVDLSDKEIDSLIKELNKLSPKVETLAVLGNHDYDHDYWNRIVPNIDWHVLDNTYEYVYYKSKTPIVFVGLDDLTVGNPDYTNAFSFLNEHEEELYTIVLAHEPDQIEEFQNYHFDLVLSGHSHLGQVRLPIIGALYTPIGSKKYYEEHYKVADAHLYISGGIGTSGIKFRFFNKPSINLYRFYTK